MNKLMTDNTIAYCPLCEEYRQEKDIIEAVLVSRGREYRWEACNRCGTAVEQVRQVLSAVI